MKTQRNNFQQKLPKIFRKFFQKNMLHIWLRGVIYDKSRIFPLYWDQGEMPAQSGAGVQTEGGAAMTRHEMLPEQYEEALFALLMESVAEAEGEKALAESRRLNESGEEIMPAETPPVPAADRPQSRGEKRPAVWPRICQGGGHGGDDRSGGDNGLHHGVRRAGELSGEKADFRLCGEIS